MELPPELERARLAGDAMAGLGVPAHVTLLFPFLEPSTIRDVELARLANVIGACPAFDFALVAVRAFPGDASRAVVYLAPEPAEPFRRLTRSIWRAWPDHPPYGGAFTELVPHLTIADPAPGVADLEALARPLLPLRRRAEDAWLLVEEEDARWSRAASFPLGTPTEAP